MNPIGGAWDVKNALDRFDLATVTAEGPDAEEALEATVSHLEAEPEVRCLHHRAAWIRAWFRLLDPARLEAILEEGILSGEDRHHLSEVVWKGRALWPSLRDCFLGESPSYVAKAEARTRVGAADVSSSRSSGEELGPLSETARDALEDLREWAESEAPELREIADRVDEDGAYSHSEETRKRVARHVLRFREVTDSVLDSVELKGADLFLGQPALTYFRLGWI